MRTRLIRIGNSRGVQIPEALIEKAGLGDVVELEFVSDKIVLRRVTESRAGWAEAAAKLAAGDDELLDPWVPTHFDDDEWSW